MSPQVDAMALSIAAEAMPSPLSGALAAFKLKVAALTNIKLFGSATASAAAAATTGAGAAVEPSAQVASAVTAARIHGVKDLTGAAGAKATAAVSGFMAQHGQLALQPDADAVMKLRDIQRATLEGITRDMQQNLPV